MHTHNVILAGWNCLHHVEAVMLLQTVRKLLLYNA